MNPSSIYWDNPPPPGTEFDIPEEGTNFSVPKTDSTPSREQLPVDNIEPVLKGPDEIKKEVESSSEKVRRRSRSKSQERHKRRRRSRSYSRRSRSRSKDRRKRSRSRSRRRHRRYSKSASRSRSRSRADYRSSRHKRRKQSRRYSRSRSRSPSHPKSRSYRSDRDKRYSESPRVKQEREHDNFDSRLEGDLIKEEDMKIEEEEESYYEPEPEPEPAPIPFKNDGSFLEMFKKMQETQKVKEEPPEQQTKKPLPAFGKRRGGKVLKTGLVQKVRNVEDEGTSAQDAWSIYMKEVRKYKEVHCDDDSKTRPLVK